MKSALLPPAHIMLAVQATARSQGSEKMKRGLSQHFQQETFRVNPLNDLGRLINLSPHQRTWRRTEGREQGRPPACFKNEDFYG